jgi:hypothetical protein
MQGEEKGVVSDEVSDEVWIRLLLVVVALVTAGWS